MVRLELVLQKKVQFPGQLHCAAHGGTKFLLYLWPAMGGSEVVMLAGSRNTQESNPFLSACVVREVMVLEGIMSRQRPCCDVSTASSLGQGPYLVQSQAHY